MRVDIWHNILWASYKGAVFSALHEASAGFRDLEFRYFQMAETEGRRAGLGRVDSAHHRYPYRLLFQGSIDRVARPRLLARVLRETWRSPADLFILTGYDRVECWAQILIARVRGAKVAIFCDSTIHDRPQTFLRAKVKRLIFQSVDGIFCYGQRSAQYVSHYGARPEQIFQRCQAAALPPGYDAARAMQARVATRCGDPADRLLYVGRLAAEKGLDTLFDAFAELRAARPAATLVLAGVGSEEARLRLRAARLGIDDAVRFLGGLHAAQLQDEYRRASLLVLPSLSEPWGLVVNEALNNGCPVVVSDRCGCVPELVHEGVSGFVHRAGDVADLRDKLEIALQQLQDPQRTAQACVRIAGLYTPARAAQQIIVGARTLLHAEAQRRGMPSDV